MKRLTVDEMKETKGGRSFTVICGDELSRGCRLCAMVDLATGMPIDYFIQCEVFPEV
jgi:hypothetical protein